MYTQIQLEIQLPVYLHTSPLPNNKYLPVTTNTCVPAHRCTCLWPINRLYLPFNVSTALHVHRCTCSSVYLFSLFLLFPHNMHSYLPLIYWGVYTQILMLLLCLRTKTYLSPQLLVYPPLSVPNHDPACSFSYFKYSI